MGYAGNSTPDFIIPTVIARRQDRHQPAYTGMEELDFYIGDEALEIKDNDQNYELNYPMKHGVIEHWSNMELYWEQCFFKYLRCEPKEHYVLLTEPPLNPPENREAMAEIMFETFNVPGIYIAVQAVLALAASWTSKKSTKLGLGQSLTGTVIDSGDGVTHIIPVADGYVLGSSIKHIPLAGRDVTKFISGFLKQREPQIPQTQLTVTAQKIKEKFCYVCSNIAKEFSKFDDSLAENIKQWSGIHKGQEWTCDVGYEQFLGPEVFFNPEIFSSEFTTPLPEVVHQVIQSCPIDYKKPLYKNIVLSGGTTMFTNFGRRLQRDIRELVSKQYGDGAQAPEANVVTHPMQRQAVWFGGSILGNTDKFFEVCLTKKQYDEIGPSVARQSQIWKTL